MFDGIKLLKYFNVKSISFDQDTGKYVIQINDRTKFTSKFTISCM